MKLIMALTTASMIVTSALMQPAAAQRSSGNEHSGMGNDETSIIYQFKLFDTDESGNLIVDTAPDNLPVDEDKIGLFKSSITDFERGSGKLPLIEGFLQPINYDSDGHPILEIPFKKLETKFSVGDLLAELIVGSDAKNYIRYSIFEEYGVTLPYINFILDPENPGKTFTPLPDPIDLDKAVNDLTYILNNNLLDGVRPSNPDLNLLVDDIYNSFLNESYIVKQGVINPQAVPEKSNAISSLLALAAFGTLYLLKRKFNPNQIITK